MGVQLAGGGEGRKVAVGTGTSWRGEAQPAGFTGLPGMACLPLALHSPVEAPSHPCSLSLSPWIPSGPHGAGLGFGTVFAASSLCNQIWPCSQNPGKGDLMGNRECKQPRV